MVLFTKNICSFVTSKLNKISGNYLEIGVYDGESIETLASLFPNKKIYGIDPFIEDGHTSWNSRRLIGEKLESQKKHTINRIKDKSNIIFFEMTSKLFYENLTIENIEKYNVEIVFIDGDHHYDNVVNDLNLAVSLLNNKKGIIILDDIHMPDVKTAQQEFLSKYQTKIVETSSFKNAVAYTIISNND